MYIAQNKISEYSSAKSYFFDPQVWLTWTCEKWLHLKNRWTRIFFTEKWKVKNLSLWFSITFKWLDFVTCVVSWHLTEHSKIVDILALCFLLLLNKLFFNTLWHFGRSHITFSLWKSSRYKRLDILNWNFFCLLLTLR